MYAAVDQSLNRVENINRDKIIGKIVTSSYMIIRTWGLFDSVYGLRAN